MPCTTMQKQNKAILYTEFNETKDWALVQTAALAINQGFDVAL